MLFWFYSSAEPDPGFWRSLSLSLAVPVVNLGLAALTGFVLVREFNHVDERRKLAGAIGLAFASLTVFGFNLFVCASRLFTASSANATGDLARRALATLSRVSPEAVLAIAVGLLCALFAMQRGYSADDPYPSYGAVHRKYRLAKQSFEEVHRRFPKVPYPSPDAEDVWA
jgi:hypothetical protein